MNTLLLGTVNSIGDPEISQDVFEELLVNALIHRDYFINASVRLFVFHDRIEIISPGTLPNHLTVEKIQTGNSILRNPILTSFVAKGLLPYRGLGTGVRRALDAWPKIKFIDDRDGCLFTIIIERVKVDVVVSNANLFEKTLSDLSSLQIEILQIINANPKISYVQIADKVGKDLSTIIRNIKQLKSLGKLNRTGPKKKGLWEIIS